MYNAMAALAKAGIKEYLYAFDEFFKSLDDYYGSGKAADMINGYCEGITIDVIYSPGINEFRNNRTIEFTVSSYRFK